MWTLVDLRRSYGTLSSRAGLREPAMAVGGRSRRPEQIAGRADALMILIFPYHL